MVGTGRGWLSRPRPAPENRKEGPAMLLLICLLPGVVIGVWLATRKERWRG